MNIKMIKQVSGNQATPKSRPRRRSGPKRFLAVASLLLVSVVLWAGWKVLTLPDPNRISSEQSTTHVKDLFTIAIRDLPFVEPEDRQAEPTRDCRLNKFNVSCYTEIDLLFKNINLENYESIASQLADKFNTRPGWRVNTYSGESPDVRDLNRHDPDRAIVRHIDVDHFARVSADVSCVVRLDLETGENLAVAVSANLRVSCSYTHRVPFGLPYPLALSLPE